MQSLKPSIMVLNSQNRYLEEKYEILRGDCRYRITLPYAKVRAIYLESPKKMSKTYWLKGNTPKNSKTITELVSAVSNYGYKSKQVVLVLLLLLLLLNNTSN